MDMTLLERTGMLAENIWQKLQSKGIESIDKPMVSIGGESGSGKTETAMALYRYVQRIGKNPVILHQDDYYHLVPAQNHQKRLEDIQWVGLQEVDFALIKEHMMAYKGGASHVRLQKINFAENTKSELVTDMGNFDFLIVEGTYVSSIAEVDYRIFLTHDYHQTIQNRLSRGREPFDPFIEQVLSIEHQIVRAYREQADIVIDHQYNIIE